ncbi:unnamed protein product [Caretta caretta]
MRLPWERPGTPGPVRGPAPQLSVPAAAATALLLLPLVLHCESSVSLPLSVLLERRDKSIPKRSLVDSGTPPGQEVQAESTGEHQQSTHRSEDTIVSRPKYIDFSCVIHVAEVV